MIELPPAADLVRLVKSEGEAALDAYAPRVDEQIDMAVAGAWLNIQAASISRMKQRTRRDGSPAWPEPDNTHGRSPVWSYRTLVLHLAAAPGRGHPGMPRGPRSESDPG